MSNLEQQIRGSLITIDLDNLCDELEKMMDQNLEQYMSMLMQALNERIPKSDNMAHGNHKDSVHVEQPSINKHIIRGFDSNNGGIQGWFPRGIQLPKIDIKKFDGNNPITRIFQMEHFFDLH